MVNNKGKIFNPILDDFLYSNDYVRCHCSNEAYFEKGKRLDKSNSLYEMTFHGSYSNYFNNGNPCIETNFINGVLNGYTKKYYKNGNIELKGFIYSWDVHRSIEIIYGLLPIWGADPLYNVKGKLERFYEDGKIEGIYYGDDCNILDLKQTYPK
jgi:antitoxin component YwqK of YwqJK toxin-antitoxin module